MYPPTKNNLSGETKSAYLLPYFYIKNLIFMICSKYMCVWISKGVKIIKYVQPLKYSFIIIELKAKINFDSVNLFSNRFDY